MMENKRTGYWGRLCAALMGRDQQPVETGSPAPGAGPPDEQMATLRARVASLELDLSEHDKQIQQMRAEYAALQVAKDRASAGAGQDQLERLFKKLSGPLSNLAVLTAVAGEGQTIESTDVLLLVKSLEKELTQAGLERIGKTGEQTRFSVAFHRRMSGGAVRDGVPVTIQVPGYRMGEKILLKAMVSAKEDQREQNNGPDSD